MEIRKLTNNRGADVAIEVSGNYKALNEAIRSVAPQSTVISMSFYQGESKQIYLGEEFHHNWINIKCSQAGMINRVLSPRWILQGELRQY